MPRMRALSVKHQMFKGKPAEAFSYVGFIFQHSESSLVQVGRPGGRLHYIGQESSWLHFGVLPAPSSGGHPPGLLGPRQTLVCITGPRCLSVMLSEGKCFLGNQT